MSSNHKPAQPESKCPELLANYCDMLLRKTPLSKKLTSDEVEAKLKDVLLGISFQNQHFLLQTENFPRLFLGPLKRISDYRGVFFHLSCVKQIGILLKFHPISEKFLYKDITKVLL